MIKWKGYTVKVRSSMTLGQQAKFLYPVKGNGTIQHCYLAGRGFDKILFPLHVNRLKFQGLHWPGGHMLFKVILYLV